MAESRRDELHSRGLGQARACRNAAVGSVGVG
jgi:hypothetical protein